MTNRKEELQKNIEKLETTVKEINVKILSVRNDFQKQLEALELTKNMFETEINALRKELQEIPPHLPRISRSVILFLKMKLQDNLKNISILLDIPLRSPLLTMTIISFMTLQNQFGNIGNIPFHF